MRTEIKWGVIFALAGLIWVTLEYLAGLHTGFIAWHPILTMFFIIPAVTIMTLAIREKKKSLGGRITFWQAFLCGMGVSLVVALPGPVNQFIFHRLINPGFFAAMIRQAVDRGGQTLEQAQAFFNFQNYVLQSVIGPVIMGAITSAIIAAIIRTRQRGGTVNAEVAS